MRLRLPTRLNLTWLLYYAAAMFCVQQFEHTPLSFSLLYFVFVLLAGIGFNLAKGFSTPVGGYICFFSILTCGLGVTWKAVLGEPANSNLEVPILDMALYTASVALLTGVILIVRRINLRKISVAKFLSKDINYTMTGLGCGICSLGLLTLDILNPPGLGQIIATTNQFLGPLLPLGILLSTVGALRDSGGRSSFNTGSVLSMAIAFAEGGLNYSKQALLTPFVCYVIAAAYMRMKIRPASAAFIVLNLLITLYIAPIWAGGREDIPRSGIDFAGSVQLAIYHVNHFDRLVAEKKIVDEQLADYGYPGYFNTTQGLFDRLNMISADDGLIRVTSQGVEEGYWPIGAYIVNWVPHFLLPNKPWLNIGNRYAHEVGETIVDEDTTTGISFSPTAEAFHFNGWISLFAVLPLTWIFVFLTTDLVVGDLREAPWGLFTLVFFAHSAAESAVSGLFAYIVTINIGISGAIFFTARISPVVGVLFSGGRAKRKPSLQRTVAAPPPPSAEPRAGLALP